MFKKILEGAERLGIVEREAEEDVSSKGKTSAHVPPSIPSRAPTMVGGPASSHSTTEPDPKWTSELEKRIKPVCSENYLDFLRMLQVLGKSIKDEATLYRAAMEAVEGLDLAELFHEIGDCDDVLASVLSDFQSGMTSRVGNAVESKKTAVEKTQTHIAKLELEIEQAKAQLKDLEREVEETTRMAEAEAAGFMAAHAAKTEYYRTLRDKVTRHLGSQGGGSGS